MDGPPELTGRSHSLGYQTDRYAAKRLAAAYRRLDRTGNQDDDSARAEVHPPEPARPSLPERSLLSPSSS